MLAAVLLFATSFVEPLLPLQRLPVLGECLGNVPPTTVYTMAQSAQTWPSYEVIAGGIHYTVGVDGGYLSGGASDMSTALYKQDYATGSSTVAALDPALLIGEMSFVPNPGADPRNTAEDDGILMGYGYHRGRDEGQLILLDAQTLESVATVHLPQRVPMGFHGNWAPAG